MSQINVKNTNSFQLPPDGYKGFGFNSQGLPVMIEPDGSTTELLTDSQESGDTFASNVLANRGIGTLANIPSTFSTGDIYVTNDTFEVYTAMDDISWESKPLIKSQFITDITGGVLSLYQYTGSMLITLVQGGLSDDTYKKDSYSFSAGENIYIPFTGSDLTSSEYSSIVLSTFDSDGYTIFPRLRSTDVDGFYIDSEVDGTINYDIKV